MEEQYTKTLEANKEHVRYNSMLVRAFIPLIPKEEREQAFKWLTKLSNTEGTPFQMKNKADYLWYFVMNAVQSQGMMPPFQSPPPAADLPPLSSVVPKEIYADVMDCVERKRWWMDEPLVEGVDEEDLHEDDQSWNLVPSEFVQNQPIPNTNGAYVYGCVFAPRRSV